ncbi:MAG: DUF4198 domain-containing protein [Desulfobacula sp.]|uniref:DUF4198 domain-containing protein n=1 Tax=Desulfobacula sp. TaxID=2593537 RepID=UPI001DC118CF|nr:DUF4198 domain-containing protein [Desulfobacula sp.]MBT5547322.1 DUF4198 domain-containing protein [Desulfobacula sp.]MBT7051826.1 DUF4198 domain-containing protein [Desulfobacula sp.]
MKCFKLCFLIIIIICFYCGLSFGHFGMVIPSDNMVMQEDSRKIDIRFSFSHPFEMIGMPLVRPQKVFVNKNGKNQDLNIGLEKIKVMNHEAWKTDYNIKRPGAYTFVMVPEPYWEPAEDCFIIHYTKTIVAAFGDDGGWDDELGLKTEIIPLSRPFGLYMGNVFQGIVKLNGKAVPYTEVEVEFYNIDQKIQAQSDYMITQTIKTDGNGVFTYAAPAAGWWGFAALNISDKKMIYNNEEKDIELGAVLWVKFERWQEK